MLPSGLRLRSDSVLSRISGMRRGPPWEEGLLRKAELQKECHALVLREEETDERGTQAQESAQHGSAFQRGVPIRHRGPAPHDTSRFPSRTCSGRSYWMPGAEAPAWSAKRNACVWSLQHTHATEESMSKARLDAIGTSTTLASHQRQLTMPPLGPSTNREPVRGQGAPASHGWGAPPVPHGGRRDARNAPAPR